MQIIGTLEADFQGGREYTTGGVGPLFREQRTEEPYTVWEMLSRCVDALAKMDILDVVSLFIDEEEILLPGEDDEAEARDERMDDADGDGDYIEFDLADEAQRAYTGEEPLGFQVILAYDDDDVSHQITVEATVDHPSEEAALSVLVRGTPMDDYLEPDEEEALQNRMDAFLMRMEAELNKELPLEAPEKEIWTEMPLNEDFSGPGSSTGLPI